MLFETQWLGKDGNKGVQTTSTSLERDVTAAFSVMERESTDMGLDFSRQLYFRSYKRLCLP